MDILFPTAYLPPSGYMAMVEKADTVIVEAFESYPKQTVRNHCNIYGPNGQQKLTIPVVKVNGNQTITRDIRISDHQPWQKIHWRSIETAYNNSPFFIFYMDYFVPFYEKKFIFLMDFNLEILHALLRIFDFEQSIRLSSGFEKNPVNMTDMRDYHRLKIVANHEIYPCYTQVFEPQYGFIPGLSILDVLFNLGPDTPNYLKGLSDVLMTENTCSV